MMPILRNPAPGVLLAALMVVQADIGTATEKAQGAADASATPPALQVPLKLGFHVIREFAAAGGLTGWIMQGPKGTYNLFLTTADGQNIISGAMVSSSGEDLAKRYIDEYVPKPELAALWEKLEHASVVVAGDQGNGAHVIYVIMDPNCIFCHLLWKALKPYEEKGLQVRWVPIGLLRPDSLPKAAALLEGGEAVLIRSQEQFDERTETAGHVDVAVTPQTRTKLDANLALLHAANVSGTPAIFFKDVAGQVHYKSGMPQASELAAITGISLPPAAVARH